MTATSGQHRVHGSIPTVSTRAENRYPPFRTVLTILDSSLSPSFFRGRLISTSMDRSKACQRFAVREAGRESAIAPGPSHDRKQQLELGRGQVGGQFTFVEHLSNPR